MQRRFIKYTISFFIPVLLGYLTVELLTLNLPMNYKTTSQFLNSHQDNIEVLILGSSQMKDGIDPSQLDKLSLNMASGDQHHNSDFKLMKGLIDRLPNLKTVVLEVSYSHFELLHNSKDFWKNSIYLKYYKVNAFERNTYFKDRLIFLSHPPFFAKKMDAHYIKKENLSGFNSFGSDTNNYSGRFKDHKYNESDIAKSNFKININSDLEIFDNNTQLFFDMITFLEERKLKVILCHTPVYKTYLPKRIPEILKRRDSIISMILSENPEIRLLNKEEDTIHYDVYDFTNQSHLNSKGAKTFSQSLNDVLNKK